MSVSINEMSRRSEAIMSSHNIFIESGITFFKARFTTSNVTAKLSLYKLACYTMSSFDATVKESNKNAYGKMFISYVDHTVR